MNVLVVLNDAPYGTERTYNGLRLALNLATKTAGAVVTVFLMGDAVTSAKSGQKTPNGYYNTERMLTGLVARGCRVLLCGTCMDARGLAAGGTIEGSSRSTMDELTELTAASDKVLVF